MQEIRLTPTSYVVLGLLDRAGEATPYDLKRMVAAGVGHVWTLQHAQLYTETERLAKAGYLVEKRERGGRRRKLYKITAEGRQALREWTAQPTAQGSELRDLALLKLFLGADPKPLSAVQIEVHRAQLREYEDRRDEVAQAPVGIRMALEAGIGHEREWVRFWRKVAGERQRRGGR
jgi:DNA-binding PadR family transcriptional regulator